MFSAIVMINHRRSLSQRLEARRFCGPYSWQPSAPGKGRGFYSGRDELAFDEAGSTLRLRLSYAYDCLPAWHSLRRVNAYHCNPYGDGDMIKPVVARLPRGRGFLAGWTMGAGMCGALDSTVYQDEADAAQAAHAMAESDAERECDAFDSLEEAA